MNKKEEEKIFNFIKENLEKDFGEIPEKMVFEILIICKTFPDFIEFYRSCFGLTILEALDKYISNLKKRKPNISRILTMQNKKRNNILYYMLLGLLFNEAFNLVGISDTNKKIDYTGSVKNLINKRKKSWKP